MQEQSTKNNLENSRCLYDGKFFTFPGNLPSFLAVAHQGLFDTKLFFRLQISPFRFGFGNLGLSVFLLSVEFGFSGTFSFQEFLLAAFGQACYRVFVRVGVLLIRGACRKYLVSIFCSYQCIAFYVPSIQVTGRPKSPFLSPTVYSTVSRSEQVSLSHIHQEEKCDTNARCRA
jgi:hypothetical protein